MMVHNKQCCQNWLMAPHSLNMWRRTTTAVSSMGRLLPSHLHSLTGGRKNPCFLQGLGHLREHFKLGKKRIYRILSLLFFLWP